MYAMHSLCVCADVYIVHIANHIHNLLLWPRILTFKCHSNLFVYVCRFNSDNNKNKNNNHRPCVHIILLWFYLSWVKFNGFSAYSNLRHLRYGRLFSFSLVLFATLFFGCCRYVLLCLVYFYLIFCSTLKFYAHKLPFR